MSRLPNFFIAGAPKTGTTSLYFYLDQHPQVYMSAIKEPHFFADEIRAGNFAPEYRRALVRDARGVRAFLSGPMNEKRFGGIVADWDDYLRLFANAGDETAVGEASVCYLWSPTAPENIAAKISGAKILVMLRDPAERAFAQYLHGLAMGSIRWSFREHIRRNLRHTSGLFCAHYPFLEFGLYSEQLARYRDRLGRNVWVGFQEDFQARPLQVYQDICRFLGVADDFSPDMNRRHLDDQVPRVGMVGALKRSRFWQAAGKVTPPGLRPLIRRGLFRKPGEMRMNSADRNYLLDFYREDIRKLSALVDRNLDAWLT